MPALLAGALVAFLQAMTLFGSPAILALPAGFHTMTTKIWSLFQYPPKPELAAAASLPPMPASSASSPMLKPTSAAPKPTQPTAQASRAPASAPAPKPASSASLFDDLWAESRGKPATSSDTGKKSMAELAKDQTSSSVWGSSKPDTGSSKDLFDLL